MRYLITLSSCIVSTLLIVGGFVADTQAMDLRLVSAKGTQLVGESADLQLFLANNTNEPAYVALWD